MLFFVRTTKGLGNTGVYARLKDTTGKFWDFTASDWVVSENVNCRKFLIEHPDADLLESLYMSDYPIPPGGPWIEEAVHASDGTVIAFDNDVMGELQSIPGMDSTLHEKLEFIFQYLAGRRTATSAIETMYKNDGTTVLGTSELSDNGVTFDKKKTQ